MTQSDTKLNLIPTLFIGIDWADQKHDCYLIHHDGRQSSMEVSHSPEAINQWIAAITNMAP